MPDAPLGFETELLALDAEVAARRTPASDRLDAAAKHLEYALTEPDDDLANKAIFTGLILLYLAGRGDAVEVVVAWLRDHAEQ